ncbi:MAG: hypothetical protein ACR652_16510 [Methylocystis sp.]|uniref:hypothetical protein n=1 Tax=Methylocystis sp. TaxID=1911079 RepID=UPI003DA40A88
MARSSDHTKDSQRGKKALGAIGVSVSLAGAVYANAPAEAAVDPASTNPNMRALDVDLHEEEAFDVGMSSFRLFDREEVKDAKPETVAWWGWGCRGCRGCGGCRGCRGCGGCRGCRGCGG